MRRWSPRPTTGGTTGTGAGATLALALALLVLAAACTGSSDEAGPDDDSTTGALTSLAEAGPDETESDQPAVDEEGTDEPRLSRAEAIEVIGGPQTIQLPTVPAIAAPDLSTLTATGREFDGDLTGILGVDVVSASCSAEGGELVYQGSTDNSFFDLAVDGSGVYREDGLEVTVGSDGSGSLRDNRVNYDIEIEVAADGSGFFADRSFANDVRLEVAADGSGVFRDQGSNVDLTIEILPDGSGTYRDRGFQTIDVDMAADGSGSFQELAGPQVHEIWSESDGTWTYHWTLDQDEVMLTVAPDGSGTFLRTGGTTDITIDVDEDGNVRYTNTLFDLDIGFVSEDGILDPELVVVSAPPSFVVAERFPALDGLAQLSPPCVSILRLDADVLFDFDAAVLRPETGPVVERLAEALIGTDQTIEVHGHTDSIGGEAYNQDLAARRAEAFAAALRAAGVTTDLETVSFGETMPVAPNERADGSDNPAGRQLNRRIEIVIPE